MTRKMSQTNHESFLSSHSGLSRKRMSELSITSDCSSSSSSSKRLHRTGSDVSNSMTTRRGPWSAEEDELLTNLVNKFGTKKWAHIADRIPGRVGKQCRERWLNHLRNDVKKTIWTDEEDRILIRAQQELGNRWSAIAKLLPGRPENSVKNRFNSLSHRLKRWEEIGQGPDANGYPNNMEPQILGMEGTYFKQPESMFEVQHSPIMVGPPPPNKNIFPPGIPYTQQQPTIQEIQTNPAVAYKHGIYAPWNLLSLPPRTIGEKKEDFGTPLVSKDNQQRFGTWKSPPTAESCASSNASSPDQSPDQQSGSKAAGLMLLATLCT